MQVESGKPRNLKANIIIAEGDNQLSPSISHGRRALEFLSHRSAPHFQSIGIFTKNLIENLYKLHIVLIPNLCYYIITRRE